MYSVLNCQYWPPLDFACRYILIVDMCTWQQHRHIVIDNGSYTGGEMYSIGLASSNQNCRYDLCLLHFLNLSLSLTLSLCHFSSSSLCVTHAHSSCTAIITVTSCVLYWVTQTMKVQVQSNVLIPVMRGVWASSGIKPLNCGWVFFNLELYSMLHTHQL